jgi:hypothetical protein
MKHQLQWKTFSEEYDEGLELFTPDGQVLFKGICDSLVTSINGEVELCLNYGNSRHIFHHALRMSGQQVVLFPTVRATELPSFFISRAIGAQIFAIEDYMALWTQLRYDCSELSKLLPMSSNDWLMLWLMQIPSGLTTLSVRNWKAWVLQNIVAEEPEGYPTVADIINSQLEVQGEVSRSKQVLEPITVYIDRQDLDIFEWKALDANERNLLLLGNNWSLRVTVQEEQEMLLQ